MATRFGTSSPNTRLKYAKTTVITSRIHTDFSTFSGIPIPVAARAAARGPAKLSAANALESIPARVMAT